MKSSAVATSSACASEGGIAFALSAGRHVGEAREHRWMSRFGRRAGALGEHQRLLAEGLERGAVARGVLEPGVLLLRR